ncbi:MAG: O-antigen ligase family protein [Endomicrobiales bacterium]|nr:O-antigen ligase family protein [Endomicrobiales bacterium]
MLRVAETINNKLIEITGKILYHGIPILYFLISIAFYLKTYDSAQIKITLIQIGGTIVLATWLVRIIEEDVGHFFRENILAVVSLFAFLISGIISYTHSPLPLASANELVRRVMYISIAVIVIKEFDSIEKLNRLFKWLFAAAFVATVYGVVQFLDGRFFPPPPEPGLDPFIWRNAFGWRIFSTFGNPNFFGDFLVVMGPIVLAMFLRSRQLHLLMLWCLITFCAIFTYSKGTWLGYAAGILLFVFFYIGFFVKSEKFKIKRVLLGMVAVTLVFVTIGVYRNLKKRPDSASFRVYTWMSTWEMINTRPVLGTGLGTFYVIYPAWRRPQIFFIEGRHNTETDHPENEYLEVWYDEGLIGFGVFLWILTLFVMSSFKNLQVFSRINRERDGGDVRAYYQLGVMTALIAQLVHNFVCVSLRFVSSGIFLWLLIGIIGALNLHHPMPKTTEEYRPGKNNIPKAVRRIIQVGIIILAVYFVKVFYGYFDADINHNMAIFFSKQGQWPQALKHYETVINRNPSFIMAHYFMGNVFNDRWMPGDADRAIGKYKDVWSLAPNYVQSHHQAGLIYLKMGEDAKRAEDGALNRGDKKAAAEYRKKKLEIWNKALSEFSKYKMIDPIFPLNYYRIAWIYIQLGDYKKAEETYLEHVSFPRKLRAPPHNPWDEDWQIRRKPEYAETYTNLGNLKFMANDMKGAEDYYNKSLEYNPEHLNTLKNLTILYGRTGRIEKANQAWFRIREIAPNDPDVQKIFRPKQ